MTFWLVLMFMTAAALAAIIWPFAFSGGAGPGSDVAVYKDQLVEIERDREAGLIGTADAEAARIEVSRRLLAANEASNSLQQPPVTSDKVQTRRLAILAVSLVFLPALAAGIYLRLGSPAAVGSPAAALTQDVTEQTSSSSDDALLNSMVAQVEGFLKDNPKDGRGWEAVAPVYIRQGRYGDAARAWQNAIANLGDSADREEGLGESLVAAADGVVTDEARRAFDRALSIDHDTVDARFYIGLAAKQHGRRDEAATIWRALIAAAPPDADWIDTVRDALAQLEEPSVPATDGLTPPEAQQAAMIRSMVEGLSERLKTEGGDADGWLRLVRSYDVLGERDKAQATLADARRALASDPDKLARFEQGLKSIDRPRESVAREAPKRSAPTVAAPPEHDNTTMQTMVDKLAQRLRTKGGDADSWLMLVRSYETLGERDKAAAAIAQARLAFASDPEKLSHFDQLLRATDGASNATSTTVEGPETQKPIVADAIPAEQQMTMIKGMVDGLAERLKRDGHDVDGWIQLIRSFVVLGQRDQALAAGQSARVALGSDAGALRRLDAAAKELGMENRALPEPPKR